MGMHHLQLRIGAESAAGQVDRFDFGAEHSLRGLRLARLLHDDTRGRTDGVEAAYGQRFGRGVVVECACHVRYLPRSPWRTSTSWSASLSLLLSTERWWWWSSSSWRSWTTTTCAT